jgi:hypothetical protein
MKNAINNLKSSSKNKNFSSTRVQYSFQYLIPSNKKFPGLLRRPWRQESRNIQGVQ